MRVPKNNELDVDAIVKAATGGQTAAADFEDGDEVKGQDGKVWYRYHVDNEVQLLRKRMEEMTDEDWLHTEITLKDVQQNRIPQELTVRFRDPQWAGRWFNKSAKDGARVNQASYMGFVPAKKEDLEWYFNSANVNDGDGAVVQGDLVLFKIHKAKLAAMLQRNFEEARMRGTRDKYLSAAEGGLMVPDNHRDHVGFTLTSHAMNETQGVGPVVPL